MASSPWASTLAILWQPGEVFGRLKERWVWFPAYAAAAAVGLAAFFAFKDAALDVLLQQAVQQTLDSGGQLPPGGEDIMRRFIFGSMIAGQLLNGLVYGLLGALLGLVVGLFVGGGLNFGQWFALLLWSLLPASLLGGPLRFWLLSTGAAGGLEQISFGPAALVGPDHNLFVLLSAFDLFSIWTAVLIGIGYAAFTGRPGKAAATVGAVFFAVPALVGMVFMALTQR